MSPENNVRKPILLLISVLCVLLAGPGCTELEARRNVQKANKLYQDGHYSEAIDLYEKALAKSNLMTAHHNLAVAAFVAFQPGVETPANQVFATKASEHFQVYLESNPDDPEIIELLTTIWLDSNQTEQALAFWTRELEEAPKSLEVLRKLGSIERMAGRYAEALQWDRRRAEVASKTEDKVSALVDIGRLQYSRLTKPDLLDYERIAVADSGIEALQDALALEPTNPNIHSLIASLYQFRALAHQVSWAQLVDASSQRYHHLMRKELQDALDAKAKEASGAAGQTPDSAQNETNAQDETKE